MNLVELVRPSWQSKANCHGRLVVFFPSAMGRTAQQQIRTKESAAKALCAECQVKDECLRFALDNDEPEGVWGGLTTAERQLIRRTA